MNYIHRPNLVQYYIDVMREEYGATPVVNKSLYTRFSEFEVRLMEHGFGVQHYAKTVARLWKDWCKKKGFKLLPVNTFLGSKSLQWYKEYAIFAIDFVGADAYQAHIYHDEFTIARVFVEQVISGNDFIMIDDVIKSLELSYEWKQAYRDGNRPVAKVAEDLAELYGIECTTTDYQELAWIIADKQEQLHER